MYDKIEANEGNVWPAVFWPNSKVALFWQNQNDQFEILKTYDWNCFVLDEDIDVDQIISAIRED